MGLRDEVLSAQANYTCGIWAADCPVTPYLMRKRQPQQLFKTKCHRGISFAGSWPVQDCFSHRLKHLAQECGLGRLVVSGRMMGGGAGGAVLARCPSCPPSPWISSRTRPLDLFIHQTHLLEIDWAGLCLLSSGPGEKPGHVTKQGRREETLGRQGEGVLSHPDSTGLLAGPPGQGQKPSRKSARRGQAPRTWTSSSAPLTVRREVRSPGQFAAATAVGHLETETSSLALRGGHTHRRSRGQPISLTSQPRQQSRRLIFSPQIGAAFNIWYLAIHTIKRFQTWSA